MKREIGIGIIGGGYMGKAHAVAYSGVGAVFDTTLRPRLARVAAGSQVSAERYAQAFGFERASPDWQTLVDDAAVEAVVIASPQDTHRGIAMAAFASGKPVFCEKPLGASLEDAKAMADMAVAAEQVAMVGFNYAGTPAFQLAKELLNEGAVGDITWFRGEHAEDFLADPKAPGLWRGQGDANGTLGDLAPHMIFAAQTLMGDITQVSAVLETVHETRPDGQVTNDDQVQGMCRFSTGTMGHLFFSRVATGRKMGLAFEVVGTKGAIRFDQEDQNALWLYRAEGAERTRGFTKILAGPEHPDYAAFCQGPGHGTGYQDQIIIEAKTFLQAIAGEVAAFPSFSDGLSVSIVADAMRKSADKGAWVEVPGR